MNEKNDEDIKREVPGSDQQRIEPVKTDIEKRNVHVKNTEPSLKEQRAEATSDGITRSEADTQEPEAPPEVRPIQSEESEGGAQEVIRNEVPQEIPQQAPFNLIQPWANDDASREQQIVRGHSRTRVSRQERVAIRQSEILQQAGIPIAEVTTRRGKYYITQDEQGGFHRVAFTRSGVMVSNMPKNFDPSLGQIWRRSNVTMNPNVGLDPSTGRFYLLDQNRSESRDSQAAVPESAGVKLDNEIDRSVSVPKDQDRIDSPGLKQHEMYSVPTREQSPKSSTASKTYEYSPPQGVPPSPEAPKGGTGAGNQTMTVRLQPGTKFKFYEDSMTLVVE